MLRLRHFHRCHPGLDPGSPRFSRTFLGSKSHSAILRGPRVKRGVTAVEPSVGTGIQKRRPPWSSLLLYQFNINFLCTVTFAHTNSDNAGVAAGAVCVFGCYVSKQLFRHVYGL